MWERSPVAATPVACISGAASRLSERQGALMRLLPLAVREEEEGGVGEEGGQWIPLTFR